MEYGEMGEMHAMASSSLYYYSLPATSSAVLNGKDRKRDYLCEEVCADHCQMFSVLSLLNY